MSQSIYTVLRFGKVNESLRVVM
jgi:hypothetical protein